MTPEQVTQVQASFQKVAPIADQAVALFYEQLFETTPELRALFIGNMEIQGQNLMAAIATVVNGLAEIEEIAPAVCHLAKRHVAYGAQPEHSSWSVRRCYGRSSRGSAVISRLPFVRRGRKPTAPCRT